jgi:hypothetical protein
MQSAVPSSTLPSPLTALQRQLSSWGVEQEEDISDVSDKLSVLLYQVGDLEDQYVDRYDQYRSTLKDIRDIEKVVQRSRDSK